MHIVLLAYIFLWNCFKRDMLHGPVLDESRIVLQANIYMVLLQKTCVMNSESCIVLLAHIYKEPLQNICFMDRWMPYCTTDIYLFGTLTRDMLYRQMHAILSSCWHIKCVKWKSTFFKWNISTSVYLFKTGKKFIQSL